MSKEWLDWFLSQHGLTLRRTTTVCQRPPKEYTEEMPDFILYIRNVETKPKSCKQNLCMVQIKHLFGWTHPLQRRLPLLDPEMCLWNWTCENADNSQADRMRKWRQTLSINASSVQACCAQDCQEISGKAYLELGRLDVDG